MQKQNTLAIAIINNKKDLNQDDFRLLEKKISRNLNAVSHNLYYYLPHQQLLDRN